MNNDIENMSVEEIKAQTLEGDMISVEIKDEAKLLIEAHDASNLAHKNLIDSMNEKIDLISTSVINLEENAVLTSDVPTKISDLENDLGFVGEETLSNAMEIMGLVNNTDMESRLEDTKTEIENGVQMITNAITTRINNIEETIPDGKRIVAAAARSNSFIKLTPPPIDGAVTMPDDGILHMGGKNETSKEGWFSAKSPVSMTYRLEVNCIVPTEVEGFEFLVKKGEVLKFYYGNFTFEDLCFFYFEGNKPEDEEEDEGE